MTSRILIIFLAIFASIIGCNPGKERNTRTDFEVPDSVISDSELSFQEETMGVIIENLASPVEVAAMLMDLGIPYSEELIVDTKIIDGLHTNFNKSLVLGYLSADLGYLNIYQKNLPLMDYISSIKNLTDDLNVGQFYDFNTLKRLSEQKHDLDSLMYISVRSFNRMNSYLESTRRGHISALVISGLWLEGMYLATQVAKDADHEELRESIGEQKIIMEDLFAVINKYKEEPGFDELISQFQLLKNEFDPVEITYEPGEPIMEEDENGMLVVTQTEKSMVNISDHQLERIIERTSDIRNHFIHL
jgi:hypothetical protein